MATKEESRLQEARRGRLTGRSGALTSARRQWGTVREDYSQDGNAWDYFSHDQARSAPTTGARMVLQESAMTSSAFASA